MAAADRPQSEAEELVAFIRMACHDLRNPLAIAMGMLELLERTAGDQLDDDGRDLLGRSSVAVRRTADMVLAIQRHVGARHRAMQPVPVDLEEVVEWIAEGLDPEQIQVRVEGSLPTVVADRDMAEWVVHELLDNALRHADGAGAVTVTVDGQEVDGRRLVTVSDDGAGITAERREEAFGAGARLDRSGGGLGLGLTIVRTVMDRHGGAVWLEDAPSGGLRVVLAWPA